MTFGRDASPRIALVKLSSLGDVVHALPAARALRAWWPQCELTWVVERREQAILADNPDVDHVVPVDTRLWRQEFRRLTGAPAVAVKVRGLVRRLKAGRFDVAVDLQGLWKSGVITALTRAPLRIGPAMAYCRERANAWFTNRHVTPPPEAVHVVDQCLAVVAGLGVELACRRRAGVPDCASAGRRGHRDVLARGGGRQGCHASRAAEPGLRR